MSTFATALGESKVSASVIDVDHYSIHGGLAVETDYIIEVVMKTEGGDTFKISKKYNGFRNLASAIRKAAEIATPNVKKEQIKKKKGDGWNSLPNHAKDLVHFSESLTLLIESVEKNYLGKLTYTYVKSISKQRRSIIDQALGMILERYPKSDLNQPGIVAWTKAVEMFFLTDHVEEDSDSVHPSRSKSKKSSMIKARGAPQASLSKSSSKPDQQGAKPDAGKSSGTNHVVPLSKKHRRSVVFREQEDKMLSEVGAELILEDNFTDGDNPPASTIVKSSSPFGDIFDNPVAFTAVAAAAIYAFRFTSQSTLTVDSDIAVLVGFACFCLGLHSPRKTETVVIKPAPPRAKARTVPLEESLQKSASTRRQSLMLKKSMMQSMQNLRKLSVPPEDKEDSTIETLEEELEDVEVGGAEQLMSPLPHFPKGAELGSVPNCVSETPPSDYKVRGAKYFVDHKKISSGPFLFPFRGVDLFLTDLCPENVGSNPGAMGGKLRDKPTFIVNFRLPWAVLLFYSEIPVRLLPFLRACYEPNFDESTLPSTEKMSPAERTAARYLKADDKQKDECLKIVPVVVKGPWVVKSVVGGKPAIIGNKMPVTYYYQPAEKGKAEYLEMDLDIVASSAARGILSVVKNYTSILTIDLGFVVEGKKEDELPEQMMVGARLHSIDPLTAPPLPPMDDLLLGVLSGPQDDD